jgi:hypothetical protein
MSGYSDDLQLVGAQMTVTAAGTRQPLAVGNSTIMKVRSVTIRALRTNTNNIYLGDSAVAAAVSYILAAGETLNFEVSMEEWKNGVSINLSKIYVDAAVTGEGVCYAYVRA